MIATEVTWIGDGSVESPGSGEWGNTNYWSTGAIPTNGDTIYINNGTVTPTRYYDLYEVTLTLNNGTVEKNGIRFYDNSTINIKGGAWKSSFEIYSGSTVNQSGGTVSSLKLAQGTYNMTGGTLSTTPYFETNGTVTFNMGTKGNETTADSPVIEGSIDFGKNNGSTMNLYEGTVALANLKFGTLTVNDGSTSTVTINLDGATVENSSYIYFGSNLTVSGGSKAYATLNMSSGTWNTDSEFSIVKNGSVEEGSEAIATLKISGGDANFKQLTVGTSESDKPQGVLEVVGSAASIEMTTITVNSGGTVKFTAGDFGLNADGTAKPIFSTVKVLEVVNYTSVDGSTKTYTGNGTATINGTVTAGLAGASVFASLDSLKGEQTLLTAGTLSSGINLVDNAIWNLEQKDKSIIATLNSTTDLEGNVAGISGTLEIDGSITTLAINEDYSQLGWINFENAIADETYALELEFEALDATQTGDWDELALYYADLFGENVAVNETDETIMLFGLSGSFLNDSAFLYDLASYNYSLANVTALDSNAIPEPATWTLLILGATALIFMRRKR